MFDTHIHYHINKGINKKLKKIMDNQSELAAKLNALTAQNEKATAEQNAKLDALQAALDAAGTVTPEVQEALDALSASIQRDDELNDDAPADETGDGEATV